MLFIVTGSTIDKMPSYLADGKTFDNDSKIFCDTHLPEMLERGKFLADYSIKQLCMIDSLDMTDEWREQISTVAEESNEDRIIVTHGTDTMPDTARFLKRNRRLANKTIVLTGAMLPYSIGEESDAMFNLGSAVSYAQVLPTGVYVVMNGQSFEADNVRKDVDAGLFKPLR